MLNKSLKDSLHACSILLQAQMDELLPQDFSESKLVEAMRYSALSDGKRIRPFLLITSAQIFGALSPETLNAAAALEFVHVYSLIHDDLPAMDDDDLRRGKPTCHKKYNEATAILAGDALLTYAFEVLSDAKTHKDASVRCELIRTLALASGFKGMAGGQMIDLETADKEITKEQLAKLHRLKTGELFMAACEMGAIIGRANIAERNALRYYANDLGLAFQIKDDILDHSSLPLGKIGLDEIAHKKLKENASVVDVIGIENSIKQLGLLKEQALSHLKIFGNKAQLLRDLVDFVITREK